MERPRIVTAALLITIGLAAFTLVFRVYLVNSLAQRHDAEALAFLAGCEGLVLGVLPLVLAGLALRPRPSRLVWRRVTYALGIIDALLWAVLAPLGGLFVAVLMSAGHGADEEGAALVLGVAALRWGWVLFKIGLLSWLFWVAHRHARA